MAANVNNLTEYTIAADFAKVAEMWNIAKDEFNYLTLYNMTRFSWRLWTILEEKYADYRGKEYPLMDSPVPTTIIVGVYLSVVLYFGPLCMRNRKPFQLRKTLVYYNIFEVFLSGYMLYEHLMAGWLFDYDLLCQPVDYSDSHQSMRMLNLYYVYYWSKLIEFADTIFFVLRKKQSQMSWLHLYHHSITPFEIFFVFRFFAGGNVTFPNILNNFVHMCMYVYYMIAALGPQYEKYLWWKKHMTIIQIIQFLIGMFHATHALVSECQFPTLISIIVIIHECALLAFFTNYYIAEYKEKRNVAKKTQ